MKIEERCYKFKIENGPIVDVTPNIISGIIPFLQNNSTDVEGGGYIVGFENAKTLNITLNDISLPASQDIRSTVFCKLKDVTHKLFLKKQSAKRNYYMGSWHTHPQMVPNPSHIDINDWNETLSKDKTGCNYAFFAIFGNEEFRLWYGDYKSCEIKELKEVERINDYYIKE